ncbi:MAG: YiiX/YebB-like N1pC/P60 family cysteine hydrolase [Pirellulales bacterium]
MLKTVLVRTAISLTVLLALFIGWAGWMAVSVYRTLSKYQPEVGDVLIQSITPCGRLLRTVKGVTESKWCHCGVVDKKNGRWVVCEAVGDGVRYTPLAHFLLRGDEIDFAVYRLQGDFKKHAAELAKCCKPYVGRPYDIQYELDDEKLYCSELVYKAYRDATHGDELGLVQRFGELNWQDFKADIAHYHGSDDLPLDRQIVTPVSLTWSKQLEKVLELQSAVPMRSKRAPAAGFSVFGAAL